MATDHVKHSDIVSYANDKVNLPGELVTEYREQVGYLRKRLEEYIREHPDYSLVKMYHSGSVAKGLALSGKTDMDVAVYVKNADTKTNESDLLNWMRDRLREVYPTLKNEQFVIGPDSHCVTLSFRGTGLDVDVSPVIYEGDPQDRGFLINKRSGERIMTSIPMHLEFTRTRKGKMPHHYSQVIRLAKWWARKQKRIDPDFHFKSFLAELICAHLQDQGKDFTDYPAALNNFFLYIVTTGLKNRIYFTDYYQPTALPTARASVIEVFDPVNPNNNIVKKYSEEDRVRIVEAAHDALDAIHEARFATTKARAVDRWQQVFGPTFNP